MLVARFFIYRCKYSKLKPNMLEYFNELNMNKKSEYIIAKRNKSLAERYKKWRNICDFLIELQYIKCYKCYGDLYFFFSFCRLCFNFDASIKIKIKKIWHSLNQTRNP